MRGVWNPIKCIGLSEPNSAHISHLGVRHGEKNDLAEELRNFNLSKMADEIEKASSGDRDFHEKLHALISMQTDDRNRRRQEQHAKDANLPIRADFESFTNPLKRGVSKGLLQLLRSKELIGEKHHVSITGSTGVGKTFLACAIGYSAIRNGFSVEYWSVPLLLRTWKDLDEDEGRPELLNRLKKIGLLVLDNWGVEPLDVWEVIVLRRLLLDRLESASVVIASPYATEEWQEWLGGGYLADSLLDRFHEFAQHVRLGETSLRKRAVPIP